MKTVSSEEIIWQRKSDIEIVIIKDEIRKSSFDLKIPLAVFCISIFITLLFIPYFSAGIQLLGCMSLAILTFLFQVLTGRSFQGKDNFQICNKCFSEDRLGNKKCFCGGLFEPYNFYNNLTNNKTHEELADEKFQDNPFIEIGTSIRKNKILN
jgi:hypothetical protein